MITEPMCDLCGDPTESAAFVCRRCATETEKALRDVVELSSEVETTVARLARYAVRGGRQAPAEVHEEAPSPFVNRSQPVETFGWPASMERPKRYALRETALPVDLNASARAAAAFTAVTTWARHCSDERGLTIPVVPGAHPAAEAAAFLCGQLDWLRHRQEAEEGFTELRAAAATIRRIVDAPPELEIVGTCDCDAYLYAHKGATTVTCRDCSARWDVQTSRETLRDALRDRLVTPAEAATFLQFFGLTGDRDRSRKTIVMWAQRGLIEAHGQMYRFGEVLDRATRHAQGGDAA